MDNASGGTYDCVVYSDTSHTCYGGYIVDKPGSEVLGTWSVSESVESSTWREPVALSVSRVFNSVVESMEGRTVRWFTGSRNVVQILKVGSSKFKLQDGAMTVVSRCQERDVTLSAEWVCRDQNVQADFLSR